MPTLKIPSTKVIITHSEGYVFIEVSAISLFSKEAEIQYGRDNYNRLNIQKALNAEAKLESIREGILYVD